MPCSKKKLPLQDMEGSEILLETHRSLFPWFLHLLGSLSTAEKLHFQVPLATWTKHRSSAGRCTASTEFSPWTQGGLGSRLSNGWFVSHSTATSPPELISLCIPKPPKAGQARSKGSWNHQYLSSACKGSSSNTNRCTGDNSCWSSCFPPGNLLSYVWA